MIGAQIRSDLVDAGARVVGDRALAEDLVQDSLVALLQLDVAPARADLWLRRVVRNKALDHLRSWRASAGDPDEIPDHAAPVDAGADRVARWLPSLVDALPEPYRGAVRAVDLEGRTQAELARELGLSTSGARTRVQRGRSLLRERLLACCAVRFEQGEVVDTGAGRCCGSREQPEVPEHS